LRKILHFLRTYLTYHLKKVFYSFNWIKD